MPATATKPQESQGVTLTADVLGGFVASILAPQYDKPKPIPEFHFDMWDSATDVTIRYLAIQAPRGHAKSTAITHAYVLAMMLFRLRDYALIFSDTEGQAIEFLADIRMELVENPVLREQFGVSHLVKDNATDIICKMTDGHLFRVRARGAEQKVRGLKWRNKRPNLVVCDDLENDEMVENPERREKVRRWFLKALLPMGSSYCLFRVVGTILHMDSLLNRLLAVPSWKALSFKAHRSIDDFSDILWPEEFPEERLRAVLEVYQQQGDPEGYAQEYLGSAIAEGNTYFRKQDFIVADESGEPITDPVVQRTLRPPTRLEYFAAGDLAISETEKADWNVFMVIGVDPKGMCHLVDLYRFRGDADVIIECMLTIGRRWNPSIFTLETEKIDKAIGPSLNRAMQRERVFLNIEKRTPSKSKTTRGRSTQKLMKAGNFRFYPYLQYYNDFTTELMTITNEGPKGAHDDFFDAFSYIGLTVDQYFEATSEEDEAEDEYEQTLYEHQDMGQSTVTGY